MAKLKKLLEKRGELHARMEEIIGMADTEERALTDEETAEFDKLEKDIGDIDATIARADSAANFEERRAAAGAEGTPGDAEREKREERAFSDFILGRNTEERANENIDMGNNTAIVPTSIASKIIKAVYDVCPIFAGATRYSVKGNLKVPVWGATDTGDNITVGYQTEFEEVLAHAGAFKSVDLSGYLASALTLIGKSVENNSQFNVTNFVVTQMAEEIARFLEGELINGTGVSAAEGAINTTNTVSGAATTDNLIMLQSRIKQVYQSKACWTMNPDVFVTLKKLKDNNGRYLLQDDVTQAFPYRILGKPVYLSDNMPEDTILYGDYSGLSVNMRENITVQLLREHYATLHAIGVLANFEFDSRITDHKKLATLTIASA